MLSRPRRRVQVAVAKRLYVDHLGDRSLESIIVRRLVSLDRHLRLGKLSDIVLSPRRGRLLPLHPADTRPDGFIDHAAGVSWPGPIEEMVGGSEPTISRNEITDRHGLSPTVSKLSICP
jgi:hypothetical protein